MDYDSILISIQYNDIEFAETSVDFPKTLKSARVSYIRPVSNVVLLPCLAGLTVARALVQFDLKNVTHGFFSVALSNSLETTREYVFTSGALSFCMEKPTS